MVLAWVVLQALQGSQSSRHEQVVCQPEWTPTFGTALGTDATVRALAVLDDGSGPALFVGGEFERAGSVAGNGIAKWDGGRWSALGSGFEGPEDFLTLAVEALAVFDAGSGPQIYAGGYLGGNVLVQTYAARFDGTSWTSLGVNGLVHALVVFDDGSGPALYAGGEFTEAGFTSNLNHVAKWNGSTWSALGLGTDGAVRALAVFDDGSGPALVAGGAFTTAGGTAASRIAKWNGTTWSALGAGANQTVRALTAFDDGGGPALFAGGAFTSAGGVACNRIARWNGTSWSNLGSGANNEVHAVTAFDDGGGPALFAAGTFTTAGGVAANRVARWNGASWTAAGAGTNAFADALAVFDDGSGARLYAGGAFVQAGGQEVRSLAAWDGASWAPIGTGSPFGNGAHAVLADLVVFDDGSGNGPELYAGGDFTRPGGATDLARWDGTAWAPLGSGTNNLVLALAVFDDGSGPALYAGGGFTSVGGISAQNIARWNGSSWSPLASGVNGFVEALTVFDDGSGAALYAGGTFTTAGGTPAARIARWNGASWSALGGGPPFTVYALKAFDDGSGPALYAGGRLSTAGGSPLDRIARWDGATWSALGAGIDGGPAPAVDALAVFDDGSGAALYAGGQFTSAGGGPAAHVARWDGTSWSALGSGIGGSPHFVADLEVFDDGGGAALYAGGYFTTAGGVSAANIARWNGTSWSPLGSGVADGLVQTMAVLTGDTGNLALLVGGSFFGAVDSGDSTLARWQGCLDVTAPSLEVPPDRIVREMPGSPPGEIVTFSVIATDNFDVSPSVVCTPPSGSLFPPGITLVTCQATDAAGNTAAASFRVLVKTKVR